jgi:DNA-binding response OmpR family regulator
MHRRFGEECRLISLDEIRRDLLYEFGPFRLSTRSWSLEYEHQPVRISKYEFVLLLEFLGRPQTLIPHSFLVNSVWADDPQMGNRSLPVYVYRLNRVLCGASNESRYIQSIWGKGYEFKSAVHVSAVEM